MGKRIKEEDKKEVKKTLIIGGDGFIGRRLAEQLKVTGKSFLATSRRKNSKKNYFDLIKTKRVPNWDNYDVVFICAGMTSYDKCEAQKNLSRKINVIGVKRLILSLKKTKAFVIYYSSSCVYSGHKKYHKETDNLVPRSEYSKQKVEIENYIEKNLKEYAIIRVGKVVNEAFPILSKWHEEIYEKRPITAYSDFTLSPILCDDLIKISLQIAKEKIIGIFNISATSEATYYTLARSFCIKMNYKNVVIQKLKASDNLALKSIAKRHSVLNTTLLRKKTGVKLMNAKKVINTILHLYKTRYYRRL